MIASARWISHVFEKKSSTRCLVKCRVKPHHTNPMSLSRSLDRTLSPTEHRRKVALCTQERCKRADGRRAWRLLWCSLFPLPLPTHPSPSPPQKNNPSPRSIRPTRSLGWPLHPAPQRPPTHAIHRQIGMPRLLSQKTPYLRPKRRPPQIAPNHPPPKNNALLFGLSLVAMMHPSSILELV